MNAFQRMVFASHNLGKLEEVQAFLADLSVEVVSVGNFSTGVPEETGKTFVENAMIKARAACQCSGLPALADDSGLVVNALNGAPGIYSSRYAGKLATDKDNVDKLLAELKNTPIEKRQASFYCALVLMRHVEDPVPIVVQSRWLGEITTAREGVGGFGYDPVFKPLGLNCTSAELTMANKNRISHRGQALSQLHAVLNT